VQLRKPLSKCCGGSKADIWTSIDGLASRTSIARVPDRTIVDRVADRTSVDRVADRTSVAVIVWQPGGRDLHRGSPADG
jgi:hypothetical protein